MIEISSSIDDAYAYLRGRWPAFPRSEDHKAIVQKTDGKTDMVFLFEKAGKQDIEIHVEGESVISRKLLRAAGIYCFGQLGLTRISARVDASDVCSIKRNTKLGFVEEGRKKQAADNGGDVILLVLWKKSAMPLFKKILRGNAQ